jgi:O-antigen ligase
MPLLLFVSLAALSLLWTADFNTGIVDLSKLIMVLLGSFIITTSVLNSHWKLNTVIWIIIVMGIFDSIVCFYSLYIYPDFTSTSLIETKDFEATLFFNSPTMIGKRGHSFSHPLTTSFWLNFALILSFGKFITSSRKKRIFIAFIILLMLNAHLTTLSKGPLISLIGGLIFLFFFIKPIKKLFFTSIAILVIIIILSFITSNITRIDKAVGYTAQSGKGESASNRLKWWKTSIEKSLEMYGIGTGTGGIQKYLKPTAPHPHSLYMHTFGELGFIGIGLLVTIYYLAFKSYFLALRETKNEYYRRILITYMGGLVAMLLAFLFDFEYKFLLGWWYIGFGFAIAKLANEAPLEYMEENLPLYKDSKSIVTSQKTTYQDSQSDYPAKYVLPF